MALYSIQHSVSSAIEIVDSNCSSSVGHVNNSYAMNIKIKYSGCLGPLTPMVTIASTLIFTFKIFIEIVFL